VIVKQNGQSDQQAGVAYANLLTNQGRNNYKRWICQHQVTNSPLSMSQNETAALVLTFLVTAGLVGSGFWWFTRKSGFDLSIITASQPDNPSFGIITPTLGRPSLGQTNSENFASVQNVPSGLFNYGAVPHGLRFD